MKKLIVSLTIFASAIASATTIGLGVDYGKTDGVSFTETTVTLAQPTSIGTFDVGVIADRFNGGSTNADGWEVGYGVSGKAGNLNLSARLGYGSKDLGDTVDTKYVSYGVEAALPFSDKTSVFVGYRHRDAEGSSYNQKRATIGLDYKFSPVVSGRVGYSNTKVAGEHFDGVTAGLSYSF